MEETSRTKTHHLDCSLHGMGRDFLEQQLLLAPVMHQSFPSKSSPLHLQVMPACSLPQNFSSIDCICASAVVQELTRLLKRCQ